MVGATPSASGVEPFTTFRENGRENAPMVQERDAFAAVLQALGHDEQARAHLNQTYTDIIVWTTTETTASRDTCRRPRRRPAESHAGNSCWLP